MCLTDINRDKMKIGDLVKRLRKSHGTKGLTLPKNKSVFAWRVFKRYFHSKNYHSIWQTFVRKGYPSNKWINDSKDASRHGFHCFNTERAARMYATGFFNSIVKKVEVDIDSIQFVGRQDGCLAFTCKRMRIVP